MPIGLYDYQVRDDAFRCRVAESLLAVRALADIG